MTRVVAAALLCALASAGLAIWLQRELVVPVVVVTASPPPPVSSAPPPAAVWAPKRAAPARPKPAPEEEPLVSLVELLRIPPPEPSGPQSVEWEKLAKPSEAQPTAAPARRLRIDYSRKKVLEDAAKQPERRQTDVGVTVRVDEADTVRLRGSARVDETDRGEPEPDQEATPNVGVEVRF